MSALPSCTCRDDGNPSGCMLHDPRSDWNRPTPFYTEALPCESCGKPTHLPRTWDAEYELWIAQDCSCTAPDEPVCPDLLPAMLEARTVGEMMDLCREHYQHCLKCSPRKETKRDTQPRMREAA